jgi:hypothetical protein
MTNPSFVNRVETLPPIGASVINFFSWLFTQGNLDLLPMLFVGMCLWIVSWTFFGFENVP